MGRFVRRSFFFSQFFEVLENQLVWNRGVFRDFSTVPLVDRVPRRPRRMRHVRELDRGVAAVYLPNAIEQPSSEFDILSISIIVNGWIVNQLLHWILFVGYQVKRLLRDIVC